MSSERPSGGGTDHKMVLVIRGELRLTAGKTAVQAAHAAVLLVRRAGSHSRRDLETWLEQGQKKIALRVETLEEMETIERKAQRAGVPTTWVEDAGFTEVPPGTRTCLGLGPSPTRLLDPITGGLPLL